MMQEKGLKAVIATSPENVGYLIGCAVPSQFLMHERLTFHVIPFDGDPHLVVVDMEEEHVKQNSKVEEVRSYKEFIDDPVEVLVQTLKELNLTKGKIGIETWYTPADAFTKLSRSMPSLSFEKCDSFLQQLATEKTEEEIKILKKIGRIAEEAELKALNAMSEGMSELDLASSISENLYKGGADLARLIVVASGERSGLPNVGPSDRVLKKGDIIRIDTLASIRYFHSDIARTAVVGKPSQEQRDVWRKLVETERRILEIIKPGIRASELYKVYWKAFDDFGLPKARFLGHGLGIGIHEQPMLAAFNDTRLEEHMVLCVEPFLLLPKVGYQLEDEIVITTDGYELISDLINTGELYQISK
jgi:Xaa-Pro aminopeptidase